ncbi:MAG: sigma 54-interacting transcriptional regulator [Ignavibacteria bacterium]|nr:sigma 54-interacting transcriptional regulator [Ignavibacteria bacterium]
MIKSHLFGHSRRGFCRSKKNKKGILGMKSMGTLFLDEIGDLPSRDTALNFSGPPESGGKYPIGETNTQSIRFLQS